MPSWHHLTHSGCVLVTLFSYPLPLETGAVDAQALKWKPCPVHRLAETPKYGKLSARGSTSQAHEGPCGER